MNKTEKLVLVVGILICLGLLILLWKSPGSNCWLGVNTVVLTMTLVTVVFYTIKTAEIAKLQAEEIGLKKKPVVTITCHDPYDYYFRTKVENASNVHAKCRIKAIIKYGDKELSLANNHHYAGSRIWALQANTVFYGHLDLKGVLDKERQGSDHLNTSTVITFESWVINYVDPNENLKNDSNKNPVVKWDWNVRERKWIPEAAP